MTDPATGTAKLGSRNYLKDRGYADPRGDAKFLLSNEIALAIEDKALTQKEAAELTCLKQPDISRIANGNVGDYSVWRLMRTLLGKDIVVDIHQSSHEQGDINANIVPCETGGRTLIQIKPLQPRSFPTGSPPACGCRHSALAISPRHAP